MDTSVRQPLNSSRFRVVRAFKALDDGVRRKWVVVARARDLPVNLPLDANARVPNVTKNPTCAEMRETLLKTPELFQVFNSGIVCTATAVELKQEGNEHVIEVAFDQEAEQGIVNGGHTYATLLNTLHDSTQYSAGKTFRDLLAQDARKGSAELAELVLHDGKLAEHVTRAREEAQVQIEFVAPVADSELLAQIARARNYTQGVDPTALQNLAGKFDLMKEVLTNEPAPFGPALVERIVWKTNQEVPEESRAVPVKLLIQMLALMNTRIYPLNGRTANEVYSRAGVVVREFGEAEGDDEEFYRSLTRLLPTLIRFYDHVYASLPGIDPSFPWADGKLDVESKRRRAAASTPILTKPCLSKVVNAFIWPIYSAFRILLVRNADGQLMFQIDPFALFEEMKTELAMTVQSFHRNQAHGIVHQVGKDKEVWLRLQYQVDRELAVRNRLAASA
jgi:AIPR protein